MSAAENVGVMYVGRKADATDNVAGTGKQWSRRGQVLLVTMDAAIRLCNFPDQWWPEQETVPTQEEVDKLVAQFHTGDRAVLKELVERDDNDDTEVEESSGPQAVTVTVDALKPAVKAKAKPKKKAKAKAKPRPIPALKKAKGIADMDADELRKYAKKEHGATLKAGLSLKKLRFEVEGLDRIRDGE